MPDTKICGVTTPEAIDAAVGGGARHIGFVLYDLSPRNIDPERMAALTQRMPSRVDRVGVFVDPDDTLVDRAIAAGNLDTLQLHKTAPDRVAALRHRTGLAVWAAVAVKTRANLEAAARYREAATHILYDAKTPDAALPGGMGVRFDWGLLDGFRHPLPWALSGGLDAENVGEAIRYTGASIVDVSSGVESAPGVKNVDKIAAFLKAVDRS